MTTREIHLGKKRTIAPAEANALVREAIKYTSSLQLSTGSKSLNAKSLMGMISLGSGIESPLRVRADGKDETAALEAVCALLEKLLEV